MASGKTTIAAALQEAGYGLLSFATGVKEVAALAYGPIDKGGLYWINDLKQGHIQITGRQVLQRVGQDIKLIDQDFWLKIVEQSIAVVDSEKNWVIDDGRFDFELDWARSRSWLVVGVNTPEPIRIQRYQTVYGRTPSSEELDHISERQVPDLLFKCDIVVQGNEDPYWNARLILEAVKKRKDVS